MSSFKGKNIAIFLDGTWNTTEDYTNIFTLYNLCLGVEIDVEEGVDDSVYAKLSAKDTACDQIRYYDSGVGNGSLWSPVLIGGAIGQGLKRNVAQAYLMVSREYEPGDRIYVFGFSRGSYTARSLIGLLNNFGVLKERYTKRPKKITGFKKLISIPLNFLASKKELKYASEAVTRYRQSATLRGEAKEREFEKFRSPNCKVQRAHRQGRDRYYVDVEFAGLFDTVGAMGIPSLFDPLGKGVNDLVKRQKPRGFFRRNFMPNRIFPENLKKACHALAVDEHRNHFLPTLWEKYDDCDDDEWEKRIEQRWFVGAHSNIGGGYPDNMLSNRPLYWMYNNAKAHNLYFGDFNLTHEKVHISEELSDSYSPLMSFAYQIMKLGRYFRPIDNLQNKNQSTAKNNHPNTRNDSSQTIDRTVFERMEKDPSYRTRNLMDLPRQILLELKNKAISRDEDIEEEVNKIQRKENELT